MTEAEQLFNQTFWRSQRLWAAISIFRTSLMKVLPAVLGQQKAQSEEVYHKLAFDPQFNRLIINGQDFAAKVDRQKFVETATEGIFKQTVGSLDAAIVVFAHSVLDAVAFDYCRVTALTAPDDWAEDIKKTQVSLADVSKANYRELLGLKLSAHLEKLERESLLTKVDRLSARCQPPAKWSPMHNYEFDSAVLKRLDGQRHDIVHGAAFGAPLQKFPVTDQSLWYLQQTPWYFMGLVHSKYGLRIDPAYIETLAVPKRL